MQNPDKPKNNDPLTAIEVTPGADLDASTILDDDSTHDDSILRELVPDSPSAAPAIGTGSTQLNANYRAIIEARAIHYPVAYRFPRELGRGRQGIVYLSLRQGARGCVTRHAIKLFDPSIYSTAKKYWTDMGRIAAQTSKLQLVKNPSLVAPDIYEESNGIGYLQMEVVNGISLRELMDGTHLAQARARSTPDEWNRITDVIFRLEDNRIKIQPGIVLYLLRRVLRGLETLHEMGFVHADVKPANIMIDRLGYIKLIDYGRAMLLNEPITILLGTPSYMAPEVHEHRIARAHSDLFSLGLVALEMLRGERLFELNTAVSDTDLVRIKKEVISNLYHLLPEHVRDNAQFLLLLQRFLDPNPDARFATAEEAVLGSNGVAALHKQLTFAGKDSEYGRELENYLSKIINPLGPA